MGVVMDEQEQVAKEANQAVCILGRWGVVAEAQGWEGEVVEKRVESVCMLIKVGSVAASVAKTIQILNFSSSMES